MPPKSPSKSADPLGALLTVLSSQNANTNASRRARETLGTCADPQTTARLLELVTQLLKAGDATRVAWIVLPIVARRLADPDLRDAPRPAVVALLKLVNNPDEWVAGAALDALAKPQPWPQDVAEVFAKKLRSPSYVVAGSALRGVVDLVPKAREKWVPVMLARLSRFRDNSEWTWIVGCLPAHFGPHRDLIDPVFRSGLRSKYAFGPYTVLAGLRQLGTKARTFVPDVLAYIGRQPAFTNEPPHLIHLDPKGTKAVPGLIRLLTHRSETARYQAACELEAFGERATAAVPALAELAGTREDSDFRADADAAQRALKAIQKGSGAAGTRRKSPTRRLLGALDQAIAKS